MLISKRSTDPSDKKLLLLVIANGITTGLCGKQQVLNNDLVFYIEVVIEQFWHLVLWQVGYVIACQRLVNQASIG